MKLILITGLPGSGKTTYATKLRDAYVRHNITVHLTSDPRTYNELSSEINHITKLQPRVWIIETPYLCIKSDQEKFENSPIKNLNFITKQKSIYFENDPLTCRQNVKYRNDNRNVESTIDYYSKQYHIPESAIIKPIWRSNQSDDLDLYA